MPVKPDKCAISTRNGTPVYYEVYGSGKPILLITGMASVLDWFAWNIPALVEAGYQVIAQDLRGSNREGIGPAAGPYTSEDMARDSIGILDDLGIGRADIFGMSMGGIVTQVIGVQHGDRVKKLIITANGLARMPDTVKLAAQGQVDDGSDISEMHKRKETREEQLALSLKIAFTPDFAQKKPERYAFFRDVLFERFAPHDATRRAQVDAAVNHDYLDELSKIEAKTLLLVGEFDTVNGGQIHEMADRIPHTECHILPNMSHGFILENADEVNQLVLDFLGRH